MLGLFIGFPEHVLGWLIGVPEHVWGWLIRFPKHVLGRLFGFSEHVLGGADGEVPDGGYLFLIWGALETYGLFMFFLMV